MKTFHLKRPALFKSDQWHFHYSPDLAPCDFYLVPKLRGSHYETIEERKEAVTKVIDTLTQEDFHGAFQKLLELYKSIAAGGDYFEEDCCFMRVLSIKVPIRKKSGNLFTDPRTTNKSEDFRRIPCDTQDFSLDYETLVSDFELQSCYDIHIHNITLAKSMYALILQKC